MIFQIPGHHIFPIADYEMQERHRQQDVLRFRLFEDNLSQDKGGDIFLGLGIDNLYVVSIADNIYNVTQGNIFAVGGVIETPVGIFFKKDGVCHICCSLFRLKDKRAYYSAHSVNQDFIQKY